MVVESGPAEGSPLQVVFEDDGATGYLYVLDHSRGPERPIVDALHIYDAETERDGDPLTLQILWHQGGRAAVLLLEGVPVAFADYDEPRFMCRSGHPPPAPEAPVRTHAWDAAALNARFT